MANRSTRHFVLDTVNKAGELYGYQLCAQTQVHAIAPSTIYGAIQRLLRERLITIVRTERHGNYPLRVIYSLTPEGRDALQRMK